LLHRGLSRPALTDREISVLRLVAAGRQNRRGHLKVLMTPRRGCLAAVAAPEGSSGTLHAAGLHSLAQSQRCALRPLALPSVFLAVPAALTLRALPLRGQAGSDLR
jgi:hypothetical protein